MKQRGGQYTLSAVSKRRQIRTLENEKDKHLEQREKAKIGLKLVNQRLREVRSK